MAWHDVRAGKGLRSRVVDGLKVLLPLAGLMLLSTLFLVSPKQDPDQSIPFADALKAGETARQQVTAPSFAGNTGTGSGLSMTAARVSPLENGQYEAESLSARLVLGDGSGLSLDAPLALVDEDGNAEMTGGVSILGSEGYVLVTDGMRADATQNTLQSLGPVVGQTPGGLLEAGQMHITAETGGPMQIRFTQGVKLIYEPTGE